MTPTLCLHRRCRWAGRGSVHSVSDIQCAARFLVVRHAEAAYPDPDPMGGPDLGLPENGKAQARALAHQVAGERVAAVRGCTRGRAAQAARVVGEELRSEE